MFRALMGKEYCRIIGLLGMPGSGKTSCLVSLYLLLAHGNVGDFTFADSKSLTALDELSRGARNWDGGMPEQMTGHTEKGGWQVGRPPALQTSSAIRSCSSCIFSFQISRENGQRT